MTVHAMNPEQQEMAWGEKGIHQKPIKITVCINVLIPNNDSLYT